MLPTMSNDYFIFLTHIFEMTAPTIFRRFFVSYLEMFFEIDVPF
jgi:hypothetical protein